MFTRNTVKSEMLKKKSFSWEPIICHLLDYKQDGINRQKMNNYLIQTLSVVTGDGLLPSENLIQQEFEFGIKDLGHDSSGRNRVLKLLYAMSYYYKKENNSDPIDEEIKELITKIVRSLNTMDISLPVQTALSRIEAKPTINNYNDYWDAGLSSGYGQLEKNGWRDCCELVLPIFNELNSIKLEDTVSCSLKVFK